MSIVLLTWVISLIVYPTNFVSEYSTDGELIDEVAFSGDGEQDPQAHLMFFDALWGTFKIKDVPKESIMLKLF